MKANNFHARLDEYTQGCLEKLSEGRKESKTAIITKVIPILYEYWAAGKKSDHTKQAFYINMLCEYLDR